ncbi:MAG: hypothetical protein K2M83_08445 [Muribaculaceae bacterium]|nr:hypothetical protein [Muribaculaceae bacterium]
MVSIAGPSIKGSKTIGYQNKAVLLRSGIPEKEADDFSKAMEATLEYKLGYLEALEVSDALIAEMRPSPPKYSKPSPTSCTPYKYFLRFFLHLIEKCIKFAP